MGYVEMKCCHCGAKCPRIGTIKEGDLFFCCAGCKMVYEIISQSDLHEYYELADTPGETMTQRQTPKYAFLDDDEINKEWVSFTDNATTKVQFHIPQIHCAGCIWLLEHLHRLDKGIIFSQVNFSRRIIDITFKRDSLTFRQVVELLYSIGYAPNLHQRTQGKSDGIDRRIFYKIGVAGFCFGNIMLLSFPEYLGIDATFGKFRQFFGYISMVLSIPVFFYCGWDYFRNALHGIRQRFINMDIPIALGMLTLFARSMYEVIYHLGGGYFDSLSGLIFFLLIGKWFQQKTYDTLLFERDYRSYFPIAVYRAQGDRYLATKIEELKVGDRIELRNNELIPSDGILISPQAYIDYSFVSGESRLIHKKQGDYIYAGGRHMGAKIHLDLEKEVSNSYLTQLWNQDIFAKDPISVKNQVNLSGVSNQVSTYFTLVVLFITLCTALYWWRVDHRVIWNAVSAVLIVACPCALALSVPFSLGNIMRIMGSKGLYVKNPEVIEKLSYITSVVMDKTGTITYKGMGGVSYDGADLNDGDKSAIKSVVGNSIHPMSIAIKEWLTDVEVTDVQMFTEEMGKGVMGQVGDVTIKIGGASFFCRKADSDGRSKVYVSINGVEKGFFEMSHQYRKGLSGVMDKIKKRFSIHILSGDNDGERSYLSEQLGITYLNFNQSPMDKLNYVKAMQDRNQRVLMLGDGLNDSGALKQSDVGIAIADNIHQFSPACDAILTADEFDKIPYFIALSHLSIRVIYMSFAISFLYNTIGVFFAVRGELSPIVAAILMPMSSITVVLFSTIATPYLSRRIKI